MLMLSFLITAAFPHRVPLVGSGPTYVSLSKGFNHLSAEKCTAFLLRDKRAVGEEAVIGHLAVIVIGGH